MTIKRLLLRMSIFSKLPVIICLLMAAGALAALGHAEPPSMDPAPDERPKIRYNRKPGEFKRNKFGLIDPTPDVISLKYMPKDAYGFVDWVKAINDGIINPKDAIDSDFTIVKEEDRVDFDGDIIIKSKLPFMPDVRFPHSAHNTWLKCSICHPKIFKKKAGDNPISMVAIWQGQFCGRCHDKVAFPIRNCFKCHSEKRTVSPVNASVNRH